MVDVNQQIQAIELQTHDVVQQANAIDIKDEATLMVASSNLKLIVETKKEIETQRKFFVDPLNDQVKAINAKFKALTGPLDAADMTIRGKVQRYREALAEVARKEQERLNKLAAQQQVRLDKKAAVEGVTAPRIQPPVVATQPRTVGNVGTRKVWKFEVESPQSVPAEYLVVDETKIRQAINSGVREIPGVKIWEAETVVVR